MLFLPEHYYLYLPSYLETNNIQVFGTLLSLYGRV